MFQVLRRLKLRNAMKIIMTANTDMKALKKILVVEDEKSLRAAIVDILLLKNFLPIEAKNGREGVELALARHPDLILLDLIMPEMDGMIALKKIREDDWGKNVPVIILTNLSEAKEPILNDAVTQYLIKSDWKLHDIMKKIQETL
jgi:DNA-binding response OmpR family regulator